jgi:hypothetical protein
VPRDGHRDGLTLDCVVVPDPVTGSPMIVPKL